MKNKLEFLIGQDANVTKEVSCAGGVILRKNKELNVREVLLIRRSPTDRWPLQWEFPRGKCVTEDKNLNNCLIREVKEETGLDVDVKFFIDKFQYLAEYGTRKSTQYNFLCSLKDDNQEVRLDYEEHDQYRWISNMGEVELMVMPEMKKTILKVLNLNSKLVDYPSTGITRRIKEMIDQFMNTKEWGEWLK